LAAANIVTSKNVDKKGAVTYIACDFTNRQDAKNAKEEKLNNWLLNPLRLFFLAYLAPWRLQF
jgi:hypothetical protein